MFIHSKLIVGGFLWSFIVGFLMTAIPRMTGTASANAAEFFFAMASVLGLSLASWAIDGRLFYGLQMVLVLFLAFYGGRRILKTAKPVPVFFSHVGMAMLLALAGSCSHFMGDSRMGIHLYHLGAILLLVLGIGTRFFSFLSGLPSDFEEKSSERRKRLFHGLGAAATACLVISGRGHSIGYLGLALISSVYLFFIWKVQRPSARPSALKHGVRAVAAALPIGFFLAWLQPPLFIMWLHVIFIGVFCLLTFSVATRVTLAHGSYPIDLEMKSPALWWMVACLALTIVARVLYGMSGGTGYLHLAVAFWFLAIASWCWSFFMKIFKPGPQSKPSC